MGRILFWTKGVDVLIVYCCILPTTTQRSEDLPSSFCCGEPPGREALSWISSICMVRRLWRGLLTFSTALGGGIRSYCAWVAIIETRHRISQLTFPTLSNFLLLVDGQYISLSDCSKMGNLPAV